MPRRFEVAHVPAHGRVNDRPLTSRVEQWDVVDTKTGIVVYEARTVFGQSGAEMAGQARDEWETQPEEIELPDYGTPGWSE